MKYDLIYADPPWSYEREVGQGVACEQYNTMSLEDIKKLPINELSNKNSILLIWVTFPKLEEAFEVIKSWGFNYRTIGFNWIKTNNDGSPFFGIGYYTKSNSEVCLICKKGKGLKVLDNTISQIVFSRKDKHSKKPHAVYFLLEKLFGNINRIELFARNKREGWDSFGNQKIDDIQKILIENKND